MMDLQEKIAVLYRTLDWMDDHPDKTITGILARDADGNGCRPYKEEAECFCFLGRLVVEAGPEERLTTNNALRRWFEPLGVSPMILSHVNDTFPDAHDRLPYLRKFIDKTVEKLP